MYASLYSLEQRLLSLGYLQVSATTLQNLSIIILNFQIRERFLSRQLHVAAESKFKISSRRASALSNTSNINLKQNREWNDFEKATIRNHATQHRNFGITAYCENIMRLPRVVVLYTTGWSTNRYCTLDWTRRDMSKVSHFGLDRLFERRMQLQLCSARS